MIFSEHMNGYRIARCLAAIGCHINLTKECVVFPDAFKQAMMQAGIKNTVVVMRTLRASSRVYANDDAKEVQRLELEGIRKKLDLKQLLRVAKFERLRQGMSSNDPNKGLWNCGQCVVLLDSQEVPSCGDLVKRIMREAHETLRGGIFADPTYRSSL